LNKSFDKLSIDLQNYGYYKGNSLRMTL